MPHKMQAPTAGGGNGAQGRALDDQSISDLSMAGKALAMLWFGTGARTEAQTREAFKAHPNWKAA